MPNQLAHLAALGLADWFIDQMDDERYHALNNIDPERDCDDPEASAYARELAAGCPLVALDDPPDALDTLIRYALLYPHQPLFYS